MTTPKKRTKKPKASAPAGPNCVVLELRVQNIKPIKAIKIIPTGPLVVLSGKNNVGKTTAVDCILYALAGKRALPPQPVRKGETSGRIVLKVGPEPALTVERRCKGDKTYLEVRDADDNVQANPQTLLDRFFRAKSVDPHDFILAEPRKQREMLLATVDLPINLDELAEQKKRIFDQRRQLKHELDSATVRLEAMPEPRPGLPAEELDVGELSQRVRKANAEIAENRESRQALDRIREENTGRNEKLVMLQKQYQETIARVNSLEAEVNEVATAIKVGVLRITDEETRVAQVSDPDVDAILERIHKADTINTMIRAQRERGELEAEVGALEKKVEDARGRLETMDQAKSKALAETKMPIAGLSFTDDGVLLGGIPFEQASESQKLRTGMAIGLAGNPGLDVVCIRNASLFDKTSMALIELLTAEFKCQTWLERVDESGQVGIVIEDGMVASTPEERASGVVEVSDAEDL